MGSHVVCYQSPRPEVVIHSTDDNKQPVIHRFDTSHNTSLQAYSFGTSINDEKGRFSLTFNPGKEVFDIATFREDKKNDDDGNSLFDKIKIMDVVEIFESRLESGEVLPAFIGVIREKKFVSQMTDSGVTRRIVISGHSVAGLVHELKMNLDMRASVITNEMAQNDEIQKELTIDLQKKGNEPRKLDDIIKIIWKRFLALSNKYQKLSNFGVGALIEKWIGDADKVFDIDKSSFHYPVASVLRGQSTQTFFDVITELVPQPVYEIFPFMDRTRGLMRLKIRETPFDTGSFGDSWEKLDSKEIESKMVKSFDLKQHDKEVYTVFFSYLKGYPVQEERAIVMAAQRIGNDPGVEIDDEKFEIYGYRPLFVTFNGYNTMGNTVKEKTETKTDGRLHNLNKRLKSWYANKDKMFSGSITMVTDLSKVMPEAGEKVQFLGGEFYVVDSEHNWNYGGSPETKITLDRGGDYSNGEFSELKNITLRYQEFRKLEKGAQNGS